MCSRSVLPILLSAGVRVVYIMYSVVCTDIFLLHIFPLQEKQVNRRAPPVHRRKRKAETSPSVDEDRESTAGPEEKKAKLDEPEVPDGRPLIMQHAGWRES